MTSVLRGGEGVPSEADIVSNLSKGGCMNWRTGGKKIQKFCGRHIWKPPYCIYSIEKFESSHGMAWGGGRFPCGSGVLRWDGEFE